MFGWWQLIGYERAYPPLCLGLGLGSSIVLGLYQARFGD